MFALHALLDRGAARGAPHFVDSPVHVIQGGELESIKRITAFIDPDNNKEDEKSSSRYSGEFGAPLDMSSSSSSRSGGGSDGGGGGLLSASDCDVLASRPAMHFPHDSLDPKVWLHRATAIRRAMAAYVRQTKKKCD